jgi:hypothetical protein
VGGLETVSGNELELLSVNESVDVLEVVSDDEMVGGLELVLETVSVSA